jgi:Xaa-Pro aminopeptidase
MSDSQTPAERSPDPETRLDVIRRLVADADLDGWLLYDFRGGNPLAHQVIGLPGNAHLTRRWFLMVPPVGAPTLLVNGIEAGNWRGHLAAISGGGAVQLRPFSDHTDLTAALGGLLRPGMRIAMEYSPQAAVPFVSRVDAGTLEQVRALGVDVVSSADLLQHFLALSDEQLTAHRTAAAGVLAAKDAGFRLIHERLQVGASVDELTVQAAVMAELSERGLITDHSAIVGFAAHAADPHYAPNTAANTALQPGQCILIDVWAQVPGMPYADITWMACAGKPGEELLAVWTAARDARDAAITLAVERGYANLQGWELDRIARDLLIAAGYGPAFFHRLGHNIHVTDHGPGVNLDDYETHDTRRLLPGLLCSVEPGVYLPERGIGVRTEIDLYFTPGGAAEVTTTAQHNLLVLGEPGVSYGDVLVGAI